MTAEPLYLAKEGNDMKHASMALLTPFLIIGAASAQIGSGAPKCETDYKEFWQRMSSGAAKALSGAQLAQLNRYALRGYDGCTAGDERFATETFFKKLEAIDPARADEFLREFERSLPAKK
jgi:hypothetical protein